MARWTIADLEPQSGKLAVITGATGGLGYETALGLALADADVILTGRNDAKGRAALQRIQKVHPKARVSYQTLDLASLASVAAFAERIAAERQAIDLLINNAGVMALPNRQTTSDGFETQFGTNYLSHYALTAHLLPLLRRGKNPRVVNLSSLMHKGGKIDFSDLQGERRYVPWKAYGQSKLAMLMFSFELQRRSDANGWGLLSVAAHPGWARTDLTANGPASSGPGRILSLLSAPVSQIFGQSAAAGALPTLFAATARAARGGGYYGPGGVAELRGWPTESKVASQARDTAVAARLWDVSEQLTGVSFATAAAVA